ncbi:membrane protein [Sinosporangium siamense]|uniref:Membrane protein n=2 Tax=Sinosporangium siamense TaxID=1367973 RepID=A0A919RB33_9ACTN|nr:membrane protein [Sinosporangium siamense]
MAVVARRRVVAVLGPVAVAAVVAGAGLYVRAVDPNEPGHYPACPFLALTGLLCPGCGTLRAVHALGHGDVLGALGLNAMFVLLVPFLGFVWGQWLVASWRARPVRWVMPGAPYLFGFLAFVIVFWIVRNLPFGQFLAP